MKYHNKHIILDEDLFSINDNSEDDILWQGKPVTVLSGLMLIRAVYNTVIIICLLALMWDYSYDLTNIRKAIMVIIAVFLPFFFRALWDVFLDFKNYKNREKVEYIISDKNLFIRSGVNDNLYAFGYENIGHIHLNEADGSSSRLGNITIFLKELNNDYVNMNLSDYRTTKEIKLEKLEESVRIYLLLKKLVEGV